MKLAYLSPFPPVPSGVSEYSVDLVPHLARLAEVRLFGGEGAGPSAAGLEVEPAARFDQERDRFDLGVYHMGNNLHHDFVAVRAARRPGLLVLHDLVLHHFWIETFCGREEGRPRWGEYLELMAESYGERGHGAGLANSHDVTSPLTLFVFPLCERLAARSRGVLVHNRRAARYLRERVAGVPVEVVEMGIPEPEVDPLPDRVEARRALGLPADAFVVGLFGFMTPMKRPEVALRAVARLAPRLASFRLAVIGEVSAALDLGRLADELGVADRLTLTGYVPYEQVKAWVAAADVFLNLRYPTAGETSASLLRLLGWGKAVVVSEYGQFRELPEDVALRVSLGPSEEAELVELLALLRRRPELERAFGEVAALHVRNRHSLAGAARAYADFAHRLVASPATAPGRIRPLAGVRTSRTPRHPAVRLRGEPLPAEPDPGGRVRLRVRALNTGDTVWLDGPRPEGGHVELGAYLRRPDGRAAGWSWALPLGRTVAPGDEWLVDSEVRLPAVEGEVELVVGIRVSGWGWLHARGSEALVWPLRLDAHAPERLPPGRSGSA